MDYREIGLDTYGHRCEFCGNSMVEVHHIDYQEHQLLEDRIRRAAKNQMELTSLLEEAKNQGYLKWNGKDLEKNNSSYNLSVLCGNCHNLVHRMDVGKKILGALDRRK